MPRLISRVLELAGIKGASPSTGVDIIGDIVILRLSEYLARDKKRIASALLSQVKNVHGVFEQQGGIEGEFRLRKLRHLAGERKSLTTHRENGCEFKIDVRRCYFSPRLSTERLRIAKLVRPRETVLNMFAGVGPFSILIARMAGAKVTSCELSSYACMLHKENDMMNKVDGLVTVLNMNAADLPKATESKFDRIVMPHPSQAHKFLPIALQMAKSGGRIHYYRHVLGRNESEASTAISSELSKLLPRRSAYTTRRVRVVGPRWVELVADVKLAR